MEQIRNSAFSNLSFIFRRGSLKRLRNLGTRSFVHFGIWNKSFEDEFEREEFENLNPVFLFEDTCLQNFTRIELHFQTRVYKAFIVKHFVKRKIEATILNANV